MRILWPEVTEPWQGWFSKHDNSQHCEAQNRGTPRIASGEGEASENAGQVTGVVGEYA